MVQLGIDVGGSGIKGALVDINSGMITSERHRIPTPIPATPEAIAETIKQIANFFNYSGNIGVGFPAAIQNGIVKTASNIDPSWIGVNAEILFSKETGSNVTVLNDADVAGYAEMILCSDKDTDGVVIFITVGTGIGSAIFINKQLLPNTEFGHVYLDNGKKAEHYASDIVRKNENLSWTKWAKRFSKYLQYMENLFYPDLFIIGGGISKKFDKYGTALNTKTIVIPATLKNQAGIIGAAILAKKNHLILNKKSEIKNINSAFK